MAAAALVVSICSALIAAFAVFIGKRSSDAAIAIERERRHSEMRPRFLVTCTKSNPGTTNRLLHVKLIGPGELECVDKLTVTVRDDNFYRMRRATSPDHVWGPVRFVPGTGPGVTTRPGAAGADPAGRATTTTIAMPVGEVHTYALEATLPPSGHQWNPEMWVTEVGTTLRLRVKSHKDGWTPWIAVGELYVGDEDTSVEIT